MNIISAIKSNYGKYLARGAGAAALYFIARDAHSYGKIRSDIQVQSKNAKAAEYYLHNTMAMDRPSKTLTDIKNGVYKLELNEQIRGFINSIIGYFKGITTTLIHDVVPLGLGLTALFAKKRALPLAKASAIGLGIYGIYTVIKEGFGLGKTSPLTNSSGQDVVL